MYLGYSKGIRIRFIKIQNIEELEFGSIIEVQLNHHHQLSWQGVPLYFNLPLTFLTNTFLSKQVIKAEKIWNNTTF